MTRLEMMDAPCSHTFWVATIRGSSSGRLISCMTLCWALNPIALIAWISHSEARLLPPPHPLGAGCEIPVLVFLACRQFHFQEGLLQRDDVPERPVMPDVFEVFGEEVAETPGQLRRPTRAVGGEQDIGHLPQRAFLRKWLAVAHIQSRNG